MADLNSSEDRMAEALERLADALGKTKEEFDDLGNTLSEAEKAEKRAIQAAIDAEKKQKEVNQKHIESIRNVTAGLTGFASQLTGSAGSFGTLKTVTGVVTKAVSDVASSFGILGKAIGGAIAAFGEVAKFVIDQFEKAYGNFEKLAETGVITTFEDMTRAGAALRLTFADTERVLTKSSKDLAALGGTALRGREEFERVALASEGARRDFQKLGISAADFSEYQIGYISLQQRYSRGQTKSFQELAEGSQSYIKELDALSKLTGISKKQLMSEQEERMRDARFRAGIATLGEQQVNTINGIMSALKGADAEALGEGLKDLIASGGIMTTEASKQTGLLLSRGGINIRDFVSSLRDGSMSMEDALIRISEASGKGADAIEPLAKVKGAELLVTQNYVAARNAEAKLAKLTSGDFAKLRNSVEKTTKETGTQNAALADAKQALYNSAINVELLAVSSDIATKAISIMADGIEIATEKMYEMGGKELPAHLKARREERKANEAYTKAVQNAQEKIITSTDELTGETTSIVLSVEEQIAPYKRELEKATRNRIAAEKAEGIRQMPTPGAAAGPAQIVAPPYPEGVDQRGRRTTETDERTRGMQQQVSGPVSGNRYSQRDLANMGIKIKPGDVQREGAEISPKLLELAKGIQDGLPGFSHFTGFNDNFHSEKKPGSRHVLGLAADFKTTRPPTPEVGAKMVQWLKSRGASIAIDEYNRPSAGATGGHFHIEVPAEGIQKLAKGGLIDSAQMALIGEAGPEAVVPLPDGKTIPVTIQNSGAQAEAMKELFVGMNNRLDAMIDILTRNANYSRNIAQNIS